MGVIVSKLAINLAIFVATVILSMSAFAQEEGSHTVATAAKMAYDKGAMELAAGNHKGAITLLKTAVRIQPENAEYQHKLAKAYLDAQKYHEMWVHLRKATVLELSNQEYAQDFLKMWKYHDLEGMLNVGTKADTILKALGEPDKRIENDRMKRWAYGFMAIDFAKGGVFRVVDLRGFSTEADQEVEMVIVKTDSSKWAVAHHQVSRTNDNLELTLKHEKIQNWSELFSKQRFPMLSRSKATVEGMVDSMHRNLKAADPNVDFQIISKSDDSILYHWRTNDTKENPAQHEIAKIIKGKKDFYRVAYVKKTTKLSDEEFAKWSKTIGDAKLAPMNKTAISAKVSNSTKKHDSKVAAWELGKSLSFAALIRGKHGPEEAVKKTLLTVSKNAQTLKVSVPRPSKLTDDANADTASAIHFLLNTAGKPIYSSLEQSHGEDHSALFELATKSTMLTMMYEPNNSTSEAFATAIKRSAQKAQLAEAIWKPLTDKVNGGSTQKEVITEIKLFQQRVASAIGS